MYSNLRLFAAILAMVMLMQVMLPQASAGKGWCKSDPVVVIDGITHHVEIEVGFPDTGGTTRSAPLFRFYIGDHVWGGVTDYGVFDGFTNSVTYVPQGSMFVRVYVYTDHFYTLKIYVDGVLKTTDVTNHGVDASLT